jgi:hypothetical protein
MSLSMPTFSGSLGCPFLGLKQFGYLWVRILKTARIDILGGLAATTGAGGDFIKGSDFGTADEASLSFRTGLNFSDDWTIANPCCFYLAHRFPFRTPSPPRRKRITV